ncbi:related to MSF1 - phenylalanine--tRNA ligase alpha chain, mitochondrial [Melanopsichium pennsylvanicum]|uniref:Phenylalanine--tRNA ligase, mitochondrial n=2 Tax=Melanopsichium pennsylvanicum TaxID=63383 RepID=A0AAJ4XHG7_9BASI|nr:related to MSF1-phenylalanine--tRNA ligase alpha chain, mitochondrial [Melanopsichium pennsylvanicum 4]SNX82565.1 related to MSF1 - phenylalanine--tRNA ligase alpha chain, mitochondrial [Melanopsichium pennsylvanicum]
MKLPTQAACRACIGARQAARPSQIHARVQILARARNGTMELPRAYNSIARSAVSTRPSFHSRPFSISRSASSPTTITILGKEYPTDDYTNIPNSILSRLAPSPTLPHTSNHPLCLLRDQIESSVGPSYTAITPTSPVVTTELNFEDLGIAADHPGRSPTDTYYVNRTTCLRTHTSAHEVETFRNKNERWLLTADVYRRDEIDASHYPIFHQVEGAAIFPHSDYAIGGKVEKECEEMEAKLSQANFEIEDAVDLSEAGGYQAHHDLREAALAVRHLKATLNGLVFELFGERHAFETKQKGGSGADPLRVRWISAFFPFTSPSYEVEVWFRGQWLEILGCGVVKQRTLDKAGIPDRLGWAFGLGLERMAMVLYSIPDIRLFWTKDPRFLGQFAASSTNAVSSAGGQAKDTSRKPKLLTFKPYSKYPPCYKDVSFWLPQDKKFHENDLFEIVRDRVGDLVEDVVKIDDFVHPKTGKQSLCYRINYRSMDRSLENDEVNALHGDVLGRLVDQLSIQIR